MIAGDAFAIVIGDAEIMLRDGEALIRRLPVPGHRLGRVARHTPAERLHEADIELRPRIAFGRQRHQPPHRHGVLAIGRRGHGLLEFGGRTGHNGGEPHG